MKFEKLSIPDVVLIKPNVFGDARGFFMETWEQKKFAAGGIDASFVQDNHSRSVQWTLRGLHYQIQQPQGKLVRVLQGKVFDVAVDIRKSSASFGKWVGAELNDENNFQMWVPEGFAHGFLVLSHTADVAYKCSDFYASQHERGIAWNDSEIGIEWPLAKGVSPLLSDKDRQAPALAEAEYFA
ncbi:MAG: dTDP-4-dehydrorhamnose 3,5-epimerase [Gammaproteobacteria bacterium]